MLKKRWFTLVELMIVIAIIWILASSLSIAIIPYMARSRDTKRITDIQNYLNNVIGSYDKNFDTFPSNYGSGGGSMNLGYCLSEIPTRTDIFAPGGINWKDGKFTTLRWWDTTAPPQDPMLQIALPSLCSMPGSYVYSRMKYNADSEIAIIAARLETRTSGNYGTGGDLTNTWKVQQIIFAKKSTIPDTSPDQLYVVTALH